MFIITPLQMLGKQMGTQNNGKKISIMMWKSTMNSIAHLKVHWLKTVTVLPPNNDVERMKKKPKTKK